MKQGALIFDERTDRYDIRFGLGDYYGGLHCGDTLTVPTISLCCWTALMLPA